MDNRAKLYLGIGIVIVFLVAGITFVNFRPQSAESAYQTPAPEEVVRQYFESWDKKNWPDMYATISDGFKKIDPDAKDLQSFIEFAESQNVSGVKINSIEIESMQMDGIEVSKDLAGMPRMTAVIKYSVEFLLKDGTFKNFSDRFTLKFRDGDIIPGWKLVHPYGKNIDTT